MGRRAGMREEGFLIIDEEIVPVWQRDIKIFLTLGLRHHGPSGRRLVEAERYLVRHGRELRDLRNGGVVVVDRPSPAPPPSRNHPKGPNDPQRRHSS